MNKIHNRYIKEANRIRENFINTIQNIENNEKIILKYKNEIKELIETDEKYIEKNKNENLEKIKEDLKNDLINIDSKIETINNKISPFLDEIEKLQKQSKDLYISIKDKYPELSEKEIQKEIFYSIKK